MLGCEATNCTRSATTLVSHWRVTTTASESSWCTEHAMHEVSQLILDQADGVDLVITVRPYEGPEDDVL